MVEPFELTDFTFVFCLLANIWNSAKAKLGVMFYQVVTELLTVKSQLTVGPTNYKSSLEVACRVNLHTGTLYVRIIRRECTCV